MTDISVNNLNKSFEIGKNILDGLSFTITQGERVGILGRNGCGKTTLFRILTEAIDFDSGTVSIAPAKRIGLISQIPVYPSGWTTEDVLVSAQSAVYKARDRMAEIERDLSSAGSDSANKTEDLLREYGSLQTDFERLGGYEADAMRSKVAAGLDINDSMRSQEFASLSGGEKTRVNLARLILEDTDILLLDEPTNHLDLHATEWLEDYIARFQGTVLAVSHDRYFLDKVAQRCIEIVDGKAEFYNGNYSFFVKERQRRFDEKMKQYEKDSAKIEQLKKAAEQMHLWAFMGADKLHKRAFSMEKRIEKLSSTEKPAQAKKLSARFKEADFSGDEVIALWSVSKSYGGRTLFDIDELEVSGSESIAVIGDNGTGKSTLIKVIMGSEVSDSGLVRLGPQVKAAYLPQIVSFKDETRTALDTMLYECRCEPQEARDRLAAFGFRGENVMIPVGALSGGERSRLKLCMLMGSDINLLILDEPTNHLDIASREWIEEALESYEQTLIFVSHDRYFIDKFATRIISFDGDGKLTDFKGNYKNYLEWRKRQEVFEKEIVRKEKKSASSKRSVSSPDKVSAKLEREIEKIEADIEALSVCEEEASTDYKKLMEIAETKKELDSRLNELYKRWEELNP